MSQTETAHRNLLVELGTEELPPKSLDTLRKAFEKELCAQLKAERLTFSGQQSFATPRRLAVVVQDLIESQPDEAIEALGPAKAAAFDAEGNPTKAAEGFARKYGVTDISQLEFAQTEKGERLCYRESRKGSNTSELLAKCIEAALAKLPIAKRMRWGAERQEFVRPVQWALILFGQETVAASIMGLTAGNTSRGHRFHANEAIVIESAETYQEQLLEAKVLVDMQKRRELIVTQVNELALNLGVQAVIKDSILQEVVALVEWPVALSGRFDKDFLEVPEEALISSMGEHQKYFHLIDNDNKLAPYFITVSNIESKDQDRVIDGNERVIRPRLADAKFFYETDLKTPLDAHIPRLEKIVFQSELGSIADKSLRVAKLGTALAADCNAQAELVERAAILAKCDLVTEMVLEFDHLQGTMGKYYAEKAGENAEVASAIYEQYLPKQAGGELAQSPTGICLALAERIDTLTGIFGINQPPTGSRDPFALRRASLGVLNTLVEHKISIDLDEALGLAYDNYSDLAVPREELIANVRSYVIDRFRAWFEDEGTPVEVFRAVRAVEPSTPYEIFRRVQAVQEFSQSEVCKDLAATNKRVANILSKEDISELPAVNATLFSSEAETELQQAITSVRSEVAKPLQTGDFATALAAMASLQQPLAMFFDSVMVMAEEQNLRLNRLALLSQVRDLVLQVADLSELGGQ